MQTKKTSLFCILRRQNGLWILKGFVLGLALLIPGLSAGTLALIMGIYEKILVSVTEMVSLERKELESFWFLLCLTTGVGLALLFLARPLAFLLFHFSLPVNSFFMGLIVASIPSLFKMTGQNKTALLGIAFWAGLVWFGFHIVSVLLEQSKLSASEISESPFIGACLKGFWDNPLCSLHMAWTLLFLSGFLAVFASVLPGLSGSFVLMVIGTYPYVLQSLTERDLIHLSVFITGGFLGFVLAFYTIRFLLKKYRKHFFCMALGIIIAGLPQFMPRYSVWSSVSLSQWAQIATFLFLGALLFFLLNHIKPVKV